MRAYTLTHLSDAALLRDLAALVARDRATTAALLAHIAEVDARRLYVPAGYESMHAYCVDALHLSEDAAFKRIQAARAARQFPMIFAAVAEGRLNLSAVCLLAPHFTEENAEALLATAEHQRISQIREFLATRVLGERTRVATLFASPSPDEFGSPTPRETSSQLATEQVEKSQVVVTTWDDSPSFPPRIALHFKVTKRTQEKLQYAQALLSHAVPSGDPAEVLDRALDALIASCEKQKFAATARPRASTPRPSARARHIPAHVKRAVWERDQGRCTFVGEQGHRCGTRRFLEFDHAEPVARGGQATVDLMRLRCRAHNQYEAERAFGAGFMKMRREEARRRAAEDRAAVEAHDASAQDTRALVSGLRHLGCRPDEARRAVEHANLACDGGTIEERLRAALKFLRPPRSTVMTKTPAVNAVAPAPPEPVPVGA